MKEDGGKYNLTQTRNWIPSRYGLKAVCVAARVIAAGDIIKHPGAGV